MSKPSTDIPDKNNRRDALKKLGLGATAGFLGGFPQANAAVPLSPPRGLPPLKIKSVKAITTCPDGIELIVVKVETSEPGLYGLGCATFRQRARPVVSAINDYLNDFCQGKDVDNVEDMWQTTYVSSYWRNGPVLNNALSGLDQALWDIKGKRANMPVYQLLGGKCRFAIDCYAHAGVDFIRIHTSQIGGITPAMKVARLAEWFNVLTAWHGPGDVSPVGHAANAHIDFAVWNFGIQEAVNFSEKLLEIFPGSPYVKNGYMYVNEVPGLGVDVNEKLAAKYPLPDKQLNNWTQVRKRNGTAIRP